MTVVACVRSALSAVQGHAADAGVARGIGQILGVRGDDGSGGGASGGGGSGGGLGAVHATDRLAASIGVQLFRSQRILHGPFPPSIQESFAASSPAGVDAASLRSLDEFIHQLFVFDIPGSYFVLTATASSLIAVMLGAGGLVIGWRIWQQRFWLFKLERRSEGMYIIPNALNSFLLFVGVYGILWTTFVVFQFLVYHERNVQLQYHIQVINLVSWMPLWFAAYFAGWGTFFTAPGALERGVLSSSRFGRLLPRPLMMNFLLLGTPPALIGSLVPFIVLGQRRHSSAFDAYLDLSRTLSEAADAASRSASGTAAPAVAQQLLAQASGVWQLEVDAVRWISLGFVLWSVWAGLLLLLFMPCGAYLVYLIWDQVRKQKRALAEVEKRGRATKKDEVHLLQDLHAHRQAAMGAAPTSLTDGRDGLGTSPPSYSLPHRPPMAAASIESQRPLGSGEPIPLLFQPLTSSAEEQAQHTSLTVVQPPTPRSAHSGEHAHLPMNKAKRSSHATSSSVLAAKRSATLNGDVPLGALQSVPASSERSVAPRHAGVESSPSASTGGATPPEARGDRANAAQAAAHDEEDGSGSSASARRHVFYPPLRADVRRRALRRPTALSTPVARYNYIRRCLINLMGLYVGVSLGALSYLGVAASLGARLYESMAAGPQSISKVVEAASLGASWAAVVYGAMTLASTFSRFFDPANAPLDEESSHRSPLMVLRRLKRGRVPASSSSFSSKAPPSTGRAASSAWAASPRNDLHPVSIGGAEAANRHHNLPMDLSRSLPPVPESELQAQEISVLGPDGDPATSVTGRPLKFDIILDRRPSQAEIEAMEHLRIGASVGGTDGLLEGGVTASRESGLDFLGADPTASSSGGRLAGRGRRGDRTAHHASSGEGSGGGGGGGLADVPRSARTFGRALFRDKWSGAPHHHQRRPLGIPEDVSAFESAELVSQTSSTSQTESQRSFREGKQVYYSTPFGPMPAPTAPRVRPLAPERSPPLSPTTLDAEGGGGGGGGVGVAAAAAAAAAGASTDTAAGDKGKSVEVAGRGLGLETGVPTSPFPPAARMRQESQATLIGSEAPGAPASPRSPLPPSAASDGVGAGSSRMTLRGLRSQSNSHLKLLAASRRDDVAAGTTAVGASAGPATATTTTARSPTTTQDGVASPIVGDSPRLSIAERSPILHRSPRHARGETMAEMKPLPDGPLPEIPPAPRLLQLFDEDVDERAATSAAAAAATVGSDGGDALGDGGHVGGGGVGAEVVGSTRISSGADVAAVGSGQRSLLPSPLWQDLRPLSAHDAGANAASSSTWSSSSSSSVAAAAAMRMLAASEPSPTSSAWPTGHGSARGSLGGRTLGCGEGGSSGSVRGSLRASMHSTSTSEVGGGIGGGGGSQGGYDESASPPPVPFLALSGQLHVDQTPPMPAPYVSPERRPIPLQPLQPPPSARRNRAVARAAAGLTGAGDAGGAELGTPSASERHTSWLVQRQQADESSAEGTVEHAPRPQASPRQREMGTSSTEEVRTRAVGAASTFALAPPNLSASSSSSSLPPLSPRPPPKSLPVEHDEDYAYI